MMFYALYRITGRSDMNDKSGLPPEWVEMLSEPVVYKHREGGKTLWGPDDHTLLVKLLHVVAIKTDLREGLASDTADDKRARAVINSVPITANSFDAWWRIERFEIDEELSEIGTKIPAEVAAQVLVTGNELVDAFFAERATRANP